MKLADARRLALALPEAAEAPHFEYTSFRVRGKIFATAPPDGAHLHVFVDDDERERAVELHPEWAEKLWWGKKVVGVRIRLARAAPAEVRRMLGNAWSRKAPRALVTEARGVE
jgi:hypothetical protein